MAKVYRVFSRASSAGTAFVGFSTDHGRKTRIEVDPEGLWQTSTVTEAALPGAIAALLRKGYRQMSKEYFFVEETGEFASKHPDFGEVSDKSNYVLFTEPPAIGEAINAIEALLHAHTAYQTSESERSWLRTQLLKTSFLVATETHPLWSLLIAEAAARNGWPITASRPGLPISSPTEDPSSWLSWLSSFFSVEQISMAQSRLGWNYGELSTQGSVGAVFNETLATDLI